jgi:dephospho-CoA kinase
MLKVGITGGIGSGKSVVCRVFATLGIPVFNADDAAKYLMSSDAALRAAITALLGQEAYDDTLPNKEKIAAIVYGQPDKLKQLNALVHPATVAYGREWLNKQQTPYAIKEAAIFFESGSYTEMDIMIGVTAPATLRTERAMKRSNLTQEKVARIMQQQMDDAEKMKRCQYVITNDDVLPVLPQVLELHRRLMEHLG